MTNRKSAKSPLNGKVALVTGAGQGIGLALIHGLAAEGCNLVLTGRNLSRLEKATHGLARYKVNALPLVCDVRKPGEVKNLAAEVRRNFRHLDVLINNAGIAHENASVATLPLASWREVIETNLTGMFVVTQTLLPLMKRGGTIVNNLSVSAKRTFSGSAAYTASKHGALGFTKTLREELRGQGIRVIALMPGAADTAIWDTFWPDAPRKKMMSAESVARAVVDALKLPEGTTVEELTITPTAGAL